MAIPNILASNPEILLTKKNNKNNLKKYKKYMKKSIKAQAQLTPWKISVDTFMVIKNSKISFNQFRDKVKMNQQKRNTTYFM